MCGLVWLARHLCLLPLLSPWQLARRRPRPMRRTWSHASRSVCLKWGNGHPTTSHWPFYKPNRSRGRCWDEISEMQRRKWPSCLAVAKRHWNGNDRVKFLFNEYFKFAKSGVVVFGMLGGKGLSGVVCSVSECPVLAAAKWPSPYMPHS